MTASHIHALDIEDLAKLRGECARLNLDIPLSDDVASLCRPVRIAARKMPNRLCVQPMEGCDATPDGAPSRLTQRRYVRYAAGRAGLIWVEATAIMANGRSNSRQLYLADETLPTFKALVNEIREAASNRWGHDVVILLQLAYAGRRITLNGAPRPVIVHHNPTLDRTSKIPDTHPLASDAELEAIRDKFIMAAGLAAEAGFDGIDLKTCHHDLLGELLAARTRPGKYGGSLENRSRLLLDIVSGVRRQSPGLILSTRTSMYDAVAPPYGFGVSMRNPNDMDLSEPLEIAQRLVNAGIEVLNISPHASPEYSEALRNSCDHAAALAETSRRLTLVKSIQEAVAGTHVVAGNLSWLQQFVPYVAAGIVETGIASLIGLARSAFGYPDIFADLTRRGHVTPEKICVMCNVCLYLVRNKMPAGCVIRDPETYEWPHSLGDCRTLKKVVER